MLNVPPTLRRCTRPAPRAHNGLKVDMSPRLNERRLCAMVRCAGERLLRALSCRNRVPDFARGDSALGIAKDPLKVPVSAEGCGT